jgi:predicted transcriptional regulator
MIEPKLKFGWSDKQIELLKKLYPNTSLHIDEICKAIGKSRHSVRQMAHKLGIKRGQKKVPKLIGKPPKYLKELLG